MAGLGGCLGSSIPASPWRARPLEGMAEVDIAAWRNDDATVKSCGQNEGGQPSKKPCACFGRRHKPGHNGMSSC